MDAEAPARPSGRAGAQSRLYGELELDADSYTDLIDTEVKRVMEYLDIHAPLRTGRRRCGQHDSRHLSDEARQANLAAESAT